MCLGAFGIGYVLSSRGPAEKENEPAEPGLDDKEITKPPENQGDDLNPPGTEKTEGEAEPGDPEEPADDPGNKKPEDENNGTPIIYAGQTLIIPVSTTGGTGTGVSQVIYEGQLNSGKKQIALTFDSGWLYDQTIPLLDVLDRYDVTATFFPRGEWVEDNKALAQEIAARGHTIGNHSLTHDHLIELSLEELRYEMRESTRIIKEITGVRPFLFRPPYGEHYSEDMLRIIAEEGYPYTIMWTVDSHDWAEELNGVVITVDYIVDQVLSKASNNGIVLMHIGLPKTVEALPRIIEGLRDRGYSFTTVDAMLPAPGQTQHIVQKGETLYSISRKYGVTVQQLIDANNL